MPLQKTSNKYSHATYGWNTSSKSYSSCHSICNIASILSLSITFCDFFETIFGAGYCWGILFLLLWLLFFFFLPFISLKSNTSHYPLIANFSKALYIFFTFSSYITKSLCAVQSFLANLVLGKSWMLP